jgi:hypothetical protein
MLKNQQQPRTTMKKGEKKKCSYYTQHNKLLSHEIIFTINIMFGETTL